MNTTRAVSRSAVRFTAAEARAAKVGGGGLISQLLTLPDGAVVPPKVYEKYSPVQIAESLVFRHHLRHEAPNAKRGKELHPRNGDVELHLYFDSDDVRSIVRRGFLNQHQTAKKDRVGSGAYQPKARARVEDLTLGVHLEKEYDGKHGNPAHVVRPKSAFARRVFEGDVFTQSAGNQYGDVAAVLQGVERRTLYTLDDSLITASRGDPFHTFYDKGPERRPRINGNGEGLVFGPVGLEQVREWHVQPGAPAALVKALRQTGRPIFTIEYQRIVTRVDHFVNVYGDLKENPRAHYRILKRPA